MTADTGNTARESDSEVGVAQCKFLTKMLFYSGRSRGRHAVLPAQSGLLPDSRNRRQVPKSIRSFSEDCNRWRFVTAKLNCSKNVLKYGYFWNGCCWKAASEDYKSGRDRSTWSRATSSLWRFRSALLRELMSNGVTLFCPASIFLSGLHTHPERSTDSGYLCPRLAVGENQTSKKN